MAKKKTKVSKNDPLLGIRCDWIETHQLTTNEADAVEIRKVLKERGYKIVRIKRRNACG